MYKETHNKNIESIKELTYNIEVLKNEINKFPLSMEEERLKQWRELLSFKDELELLIFTLLDMNQVNITCSIKDFKIKNTI